MWHSYDSGGCGGIVYHDRMYDNESFIDLSCLDCGKRWHVDLKNRFAQWVIGRG